MDGKDQPPVQEFAEKAKVEALILKWIDELNNIDIEDDLDAEEDE